MSYNHTQVGKFIIYVTIALGIYLLFIWVLSEFKGRIFILTIALMVFVSSFSSLNVRIDKKYLQIKFGYGIFKKRYLLKDIASAKIVRNHWYFGYGIRYWVPSRMWIFNVSGLDAVEIKMKNGKIRRIGTDEPKKLERAINQTIN